MKSYCGNEENYRKYLCGEEKWREGRGRTPQYVDPDTTYNQEGSEFYQKLTDFLNQRENEFVKEGSIKESEKWTYEFHHLQSEYFPQSIWAIDKDNKAMLFLRSDQFGWTAPKKHRNDRSWSNNYPYARYLNEKTDKKAASEAVAKWVCKTRTLGGSFLWPVQKYQGKWQVLYNMHRGIASYIEDSVDLTLFEIQQAYNFLGGEEYENCIITEEIADQPMAIWLKHFSNFKKFIEFFQFDNFVDKYKNWSPIDITYDNGVIDTKKVQEIKENYQWAKGEIKQSRLLELSTNELEKTLEKVSQMAQTRTARMLDSIFQYNALPQSKQKQLEH